MAGEWLAYAAALLPFVGVGLAVLGVGYAAYKNRVTRERLALDPPFDPRAPLEELARVNDQLAAEARHTRAILDATRETVLRGVRG